jgi:amino acid transporter
MAADIGIACLAVWTLTAVVGLVQCLLIAELASRYPQKVGGAPAYNHEGLKHLSPLFGAVSAWGYWVGWVPGVAVNLTLAARYLRATFCPGANVLTVTLVLVVGLYALNCLGLRFSACTACLMASCALIPLLVILGAPVVRGTVWHGASLSWLPPHGGALWSPSTLALLAKWTFVAVWSSYGGEMVATMIGELRHPQRDIPRVIGVAATVTLAAFAGVPTAMVAIVGLDGLAGEPYVVFLTAARASFGELGTQVVSLMLIAALVLSAQLFIISSSRALHQMSKDGLTVGAYRRLNRYGVPTGSVGWDAVVTLSLLAIFGDNVVNVVAAANVGYLLVFVLLPLAYILVRVRARGRHPGLTLPAFMVPVATVILVFNGIVLVVGGSQWGPGVVAVGGLLVLSFLPFHLRARWRRMEAAGPGPTEDCD